ncbi:hypothetical protein SAMN06265374_0585 [Roseibium denhamense]|uniref:Uncharacterized protein n=1 Tax=Roseibium denhamense TaxID=76305 RepID=A0ABY1N9G8_9HYPH|nr:hypothetical protein SAMN06265374_0585 [Roseibium denhamense]
MHLAWKKARTRFLYEPCASYEGKRCRKTRSVLNAHVLGDVFGGAADAVCGPF